ncbi:MAG TPA: type VI secretion system ATPase TssH, partial [Planctomycetota bacterium]|nr:type VI secretion system ATPase TssH [Planctomycetota bacterium]
VDKLDTVCRKTLEDAAGLCLSRTHYNVEIEHWLAKLIEVPDTDIAALFRFYEIDRDRVATQLQRRLDSFKTGNGRAPGLAPDLVELLREAWLHASVQFGAASTRSGHVLYALVATPSFRTLAIDAAPELQKISADELAKDLRDVIAETAESVEAAASAGPARVAGMPAPPGSAAEALDRFTVDLTKWAREGRIDPIVGRDEEIRQIVDILTRRRQNNPILTGEAGVGKTAVVEGFAQRVARGDVPPSLRDVVVRTLDLGLLQAGAGVKGEFENRLKSVIEGVKASPSPVVLFIDEAHTLIGAGGQAGQGDAANLLKPALARGELRTIAATTWAEYKEYFEKDAALARRFQVVKVEEPSEENAIGMLRSLVDTLETHHGVDILDEGLQAAVRLSKRYISGRQLPDKAVSLLDTACARVQLSQSATPPAIEDATRRIEAIATAVSILERENATGLDQSAQIRELDERRAAAQKELDELEIRYRREKELVERVRSLRHELRARAAPPANGSRANGSEAANDAPASASERPLATIRAELDEARDALAAIQGEHPLVQVHVDGQAVAEVVSDWTGIPVGRMVSDEIRSVLTLKEKLEERIVGQAHALEALAQSIRTSRANLTDPRRPIGVFLMVGSSGVGKTETAIALSELLYGGDQNMTVINMSEFKEEHKVSLLMGSPPGYVGYGKGGVLTEAVRRRPYSVVLLDEMEKAHPGVQDIFYQVFDKGTLRDGEGRDIDFKNTVIIMTSNAGTDEIKKLCADPDTRPDPDALAEALHPVLVKTFRPAFLGRVTLLPYYPLTDDVMRSIVERQLELVGRRVRENHRASFDWDSQVVESIVGRCKEVDTGARNVHHILNRTLLPELSTEFLARLA